MLASLALLFAAGLLGAAMNGLAGGGSFVTLPALIAAGVPPVQANASSTVALYPGGVASAWTYYKGGIATTAVCGIRLRHMLAVTLLGGLAGSVLLIATPGAAFTLILPWLLLAATLGLAFGRRIGETMRGGATPRPATVLAAQFALGVYGGYFGGAVGLMMMATWCVLGEADIKRINGPRTAMVSAANSIAVLVFVLAGAVWWAQTVAMLAGGLVGGTLGARLGRVLPAEIVRWGTLAATSAITAIFFWRAYG